MPDYSKGIIYKITSGQTDDVYYGSTVNFKKRKSDYKIQYKCWLKGTGNYYHIFKVMEHPDWEMEKIEDYPCANKTELCKREGWYHRNFECVNKKVAGLTKKETIDKSNTKRLKPIICDLCGCQTSKQCIKRHQKTKKCKNLIWKLISNEFNNILINI